jgi:tetratricopeptide (TPR) repeat protein
MAIGSTLKLAAVSLLAALLSITAMAGGRNNTLPDQDQTATGQTSRKTESPEDKARKQAYLRFMEAQRLKSARRLNEAIEAYKDAIRLDPTAAEPHADLGELYLFYFNTSRLGDAEREGLEAVRLDAKCVDGHKLLARIYVLSVRMEQKPKPGQVEKAIRSYEEVTKLDPANAEAWAFLAELYEMKDDTARQIQALEKWAGAPPSIETGFYRALMNSDLSADQAYYKLSQLYLQQGKNQQAVMAARRAYEAEPESNAYARNLISVLRMAGSGEDELETYARLAKTANSPALQIGYGSALVRAGRYAEAVEKLSAYLKSDPANSSAVGLLAIAQRRANQRAEAVETLKAGIARVAPDARLNLTLELAETYDEMGRTDDAITQYEQVFETFMTAGKLTSRNTDLFVNVVTKLTQAHRRVGNKQKLQTAFTRARQLLGENSPQLDLMAIETLREEGKRREALDMTRIAGRRYPDDRSFKLTEALILGELGNFKESIELLRGMVKGTAEDAAEDANVYMILSSIEMQSGQFQAAEATIRKALEINPTEGDLLIQLSSVQDRAGQYEASEKTLRQVLQREPDNATALNNLGYFLIERGKNLEEARKLIEKAVNIEPMNGSFLDSLGWVHYKLGHLEQAREHLEKAASYSRRNSTVFEHLGDVLRDLGRVPEARRQWEKALELSVEADEMARLKDKLKR